MIINRRVLIAALGSLLLASPALAQDKIKAVATFSILADFVKNVGGERVELATLVGPNGDAHVYSPSPADGKTLAAAKLVFINGLGFEGWINRLIKASGTHAQVIVATKGIKPRAAERERGRGHGHDEADPHAWQSVVNAKVYVGNIRDALIAADPAGRSVYEANAKAYLDTLDALDAEVREAVGRVPADRRKVISSHDAFGYFAEAYGLTFIAPQGVSTESEASARDVAKIITQIKTQKIPAVFVENVTDERLLRRIGQETGAKVGGTLYSDALTDQKGGAPTYIEMMRHNIRALSAALGS